MHCGAELQHFVGVVASRPTEAEGMIILQDVLRARTSRSWAIVASTPTASKPQTQAGEMC